MGLQASDFGLDEWKIANENFGKFDDRQHDLRKYGFIFLGALIAADAITKLIATDDRIRLAVTGITLLLTVALRLLDKHYDLIKSAIALRASIIEKRLNLELIDTITDRGKIYGFGLYVFVVYTSFALVAGFVGISVLYPDVILLPIVVTFTLVAIVFLVFIHRLKPELAHIVDWSFDRIVCRKGEKIRITVTNVCPEDTASFVKDSPVWEINQEGENNPLIKKASENIVIQPCNNYNWVLETESLSPGIYRIYPYDVVEQGGQKWDYPLTRSITILDPEQVADSTVNPSNSGKSKKI